MRWSWVFYNLCALAILAGLGACDEKAGVQSATSATSKSGGARIASLVPAATDILLGMGARSQLVAVSNYDSAPEVADLPRVGDYQTTDWEQLARLRPDVMIIQIAPERLPPGLARKAAELGIRLENVSIHRLEDVLRTAGQLGAAAERPADAEAAQRRLREKLATVKSGVAGRPPVRVLIVRDADGQEVIGPNNYLDDLLAYANATNAAAGLASAYPSIDREAITALAPEAVVVLLPGASPPVVARAERFWAQMTQTPAAQNGRVFIITDRLALVPGLHLGDLAERIATLLHPPITPL